MLSITWLQANFQESSPNRRTVAIIGLALITASLAAHGFTRTSLYTRLSSWSRYRLMRAQGQREDVVKAYIWSFLAGILLALVPAGLLIWRSELHQVDWNEYGFLDKRWLAASYLLAIAVLLVFPVVMLKLIFSSAKDASREAETSPPPPKFAVATLVKIISGVVVALYFWGPPWNLAERSDLLLDLHEPAHLGALQAIQQGRMPYTEAAQTYGPGTQLLTYWYMKITSFDLVGFRNSLAVLNVGAAAVFCSLCFLLVNPVLATLTIVLARVLSPFGFFYFLDDTRFEYYLGWPNAWRTMAPLLLAVSIPSLIRHVPVESRLSGWAIAGGLVWGLLSWMGQENLVSGALTFCLLSCLLWATNTFASKPILLTALGLAIGLGIFWLPILGFYLANGQLVSFVSQYFSVATLVAQGYSNVWWISWGSRWGYLFYTTPFLAGAIGWVVLYFRRENVTLPLAPSRVLLLSLVSSLMISYMGALYRSDYPHYQASTTALPLMIVLSVWWLPKILANRRRGRALVRIALIALIAYLFPWSESEARKLTFLRNPLDLRILPERVNSSPGKYRGIGYDRLGYQHLELKDRCCEFSDTSNEDFLRLTQALYNHVGKRKVLVVDSIADLDPGTLYFFADLNPASRHTSPHHTIPHSLARSEFLAELELADLECIVTTDPDGASEERRIFERKHPAFSVVTGRTADASWSVLCGE